MPETDETPKAKSSKREIPDASSPKHSNVIIPEELIAVRPVASSNISCGERICRICHEPASNGSLMTPCLCKGTMGQVHRLCIEEWLTSSHRTRCEICDFQYNCTVKPKHNRCTSLFFWCRDADSRADVHNFLFDVLCFLILTPLAVCSSYLCVTGAEAYRLRSSKLQEGITGNEATWTTIGLYALTSTLVIAYYLWVIVAIRYHYQIWNKWSTENVVIRVLPVNKTSTSRTPQEVLLIGQQGYNIV